MTESTAPLVTFAVIAYNQQAFISAAVESALEQDYPNLEILVSDDASRDATFQLIEAAVARYRGPHRVRVNRNRDNLGLIDHVNRIFEMSRGELVVIAAGDDISMPQRTRALAERYFAAGSRRPGLLHSSAMRIDPEGVELGLLLPPIEQRRMDLRDIATACSLYIGATGAWSPDLYRRFGPMRARGSYEDLILGFRAALDGGLAYIDAPLVRYRVGVGMTRRDGDGGIARAFLRAERRDAALCVETLTQRMEDLERLPDRASLRRLLHREHHRHVLRQRLLTAPTAAWRDSSPGDRARLLATLPHEARRALNFVVDAHRAARRR